MLSVRALRVSYRGAIRGLRGVAVDLSDRQVVSVLGSNGAGKTTLLRAISGTLAGVGGAIEEGTVELDGRVLSGRSAADVVAAGIVQVPEGRCVFARLTVEENLRIGAFSKRDGAARRRERDRVLDLFPPLRDRLGDQAGLLSGGQQQMLAIGRALMASPRFLLLDEPSLGLAPQVVEHVGEVIRHINEQGTGVLLVEQNAAMALSVASEALVLTVGEVSLAGPAAELLDDPRVRDLYLGAGTDSGDGSRGVTMATPSLGRWVG
jgi:branched-chain amino acid transport system ATP-binding protein